MPASVAFHPGKTAMQIPAVQIPVNDLFYPGPPEAVSPFVTILPFRLQGFEMRLYTLVITADLWVAGGVNGREVDCGYRNRHGGILCGENAVAITGSKSKCQC